MTWFKLDDQFPRHPKVLQCSAETMWLHVSAGCYCAQYLTDGLIPKRAIPGMTTVRKWEACADTLVRVGLWHEVDADTYELHDYLEYNPSREQVEEERRKARERRTKGGQRSGERRANVTNPDPTRPDVPTEHTLALVPSAAPKKRGTRLPEPFDVTPEMQLWVTERFPELDWQEATRGWMDHWRAQPGQKGVMLDWVATWRTGMRNAKKWGTA